MCHAAGQPLVRKAWRCTSHFVFTDSQSKDDLTVLAEEVQGLLQR